MSQFFLKAMAGFAMGLLLSACATTERQTSWPAIASASHDEIRFDFPRGMQWEVVAQERDAGGYSRSWRLASAAGVAAEQGFYINFGRGMTTSLTESMHQVEKAMQMQGCRDVVLRVWERGKDFLTFTVMAKQCQKGRPVWQIFRVVNRPDGQYASVYSANPNTVSATVRQQMAYTVEHSEVVPRVVSERRRP